MDNLDVDRWLSGPIISRVEIPPRGIVRILGEHNLVREVVPKLRVVLKECFLKYATILNWTQEKIDKLVLEGIVIPSMIDISIGKGVYVKTGFRFTDKAEREYRDFLGEINNSYDFSEDM